MDESVIAVAVDATVDERPMEVVPDACVGVKLDVSASGFGVV